MSETATGDSIAADAIVRADRLLAFVETLTPIVDECKLHWKGSDLVASVVDPANVAMIRPCRLSAAAFEHYDAADDVTIGVNLNSITDRVGTANDDTLVHLTVDMETRHLRLSFGAVDHTVAIIDPDTIRPEPEGTSLDLPNTVTVHGDQLDEVVTHIDLVSDHLSIEADPETEVVRFYARGDTDDATVEYGNDDVADARVVEQTESVYSMDYVEELTAPIPDDTEVELTFGEEFPMLFDWTAVEGHLSVHQMLAPRIQSN